MSKMNDLVTALDDLCTVGKQLVAGGEDLIRIATYMKLSFSDNEEPALFRAFSLPRAQFCRFPCQHRRTHNKANCFHRLMYYKWFSSELGAPLLSMTGCQYPRKHSE